MDNRVVLVGFPAPYVAGGSFRLWPLAENLEKCGWRPLLLCPQLDSEAPFETLQLRFESRLDSLGEDLRQTSKLFRPALRVAGEVMTYPSPFNGWTRYVRQALGDLLMSGYQYVITCAPISSHIAVAQLRSRYDFTWIADFPDPWSFNHNYGYSFLRQWLDRRKELATLRGADVITTTSGPWAHKFRVMHNWKRVTAIPHGYSQQVSYSSPANPRMTVCYTGSIYKRQALDVFLAGLKQVSGLDTVFVGSYSPLFEPLPANVTLRSSVSRSRSLEMQRQADVLLVLDWNGDSGVLPYKLFEYLGAGRPIMAIGNNPSSSLARIIMETGAGVYCSSAGAVADTLLLFMSEHKKTGRVPFNGVPEQVAEYSAVKMAGRFASLLRSLVACKI